MIYWHQFKPASQFNMKQLGVMPQVSHDQGWNIFTQGEDFKGLIYNINQREKFPTEFIVPKLIANKKAKVSDFLQLGSLTIGTFILSERGKLLLDDLKLPDHQLYPTIAIFKNQEIPYFIYHFYESDNENIDFETTRFKYFIPSKPNDLLIDESAYEKYDPKVEFELLNINEFRKRKSLISEKYVGIGVTDLVLKAQPETADLIYIKDCGVLSFFISNTMKEVLIKNKISAWSFNSHEKYKLNGIYDFLSY